MGSINTYPKNRHIEGIGKICWFCPFPVATHSSYDGDTNTTYDCPMKRCIAPGFDDITRFRFYPDKLGDIAKTYQEDWRKLTRKQKKEIQTKILERMRKHQPIS